MDAALNSLVVRATFLAAVLVAPPALAQAPQTALGDSAKGLIGSWEFSNAGRDKICTATFADKKTAAGLAVTFSKDCDRLFPVVADIAGWVFPDNDLLRLVDTEGRTLIEFSEVEDGVYEAPTPGLGVLFLQNAASAAGTPAKLPDQMAGDWTMRRGDTIICTATLSMTPAADGFSVTFKPGCDAAIVRANFTHWRLDRGILLVGVARGAPWRFEEIESDIWRRVPESASEITLTRQP
ncbi:MAG TPA: AprI/Inh family metalloprotease inhibitor [Pseudolabrys sp.]|nr:AprI/Inh family metalloprotease inhibitor [Pseudolabrys sp.]